MAVTETFIIPGIYGDKKAEEEAHQRRLARIEKYLKSKAAHEEEYILVEAEPATQKQDDREKELLLSKAATEIARKQPSSASQEEKTVSREDYFAPPKA